MKLPLAGLILVAAGAVVVALMTTPRVAAASNYSYVPPCPRGAYSADGNFSPLFCKIVNPRALKFYRTLAPHLFTLGPSASPQQVVTALRADKKRTTNPEICAAYLIVSWRWHWQFPWSPAEVVTGYPCTR